MHNVTQRLPLAMTRGAQSGTSNLTQRLPAAMTKGGKIGSVILIALELRFCRFTFLKLKTLDDMTTQQKPEIIKEIEKVLGKSLIQSPFEGQLDPLRGLVAIQKDAPQKYLLDAEGRLIGLNLSSSGLDNGKWGKIVALLEGDEVKLQALNLSENKLAGFLIPNSFEALKILDLSENKITTVSFRSNGLKALREIYLHDNPLISPPPDVVKLGMHEILKWIRAENKRPVLEAKVMFIGDSNFGKTHLIEMLKHNKITREIKTTHRIERERLADAPSPEGPIRLNVWDLGGQQFMRSTHQFFFTERTLYVLVTVARRERKDLKHWLELVRKIGKDAPVLVVINKTDLDDHDIDRGPLKRDYPNIVGFVKTAIYDNEKSGIVALDTIQSLRDKICKIVVDKEKMPSVFVEQRPEWFTVKSELECMDEEYISFESYQKMKHIEDLSEEEQVINLKQLASLGTVVSFVEDPRLMHTHVINPKWITDGVYSLINDKKVKDDCKGEFSFKDFKRLLDPKRYPSSKYSFLVDLMENFKLCYPVKKTKDVFLLPDLFDDIEPTDVWPEDIDSMEFRLNYGSYPPDLFITQFIVERYEDIIDEKRWRSGVVIGEGKCNAIVRRSFKDEHIEIEVIGPENMRRGYLHILLDVFRVLHKPFEKLKVKREVPYKGLWLNYDHLLTYESNKQPYFHPELEEIIDVSKILHGYGRPNEPDSKFPDREYFDKKFNEMQSGINSIFNMIDVEFRADLETVLGKLDELKVSEDKAEGLLNNIEELMKGIPEEEALKVEWQGKKSQIEALKVDYKGKLELTIPFIPGILSYKTEISTDFNGSIRKKLKSAWSDLITGIAFVENDKI